MPDRDKDEQESSKPLVSRGVASILAALGAGGLAYGALRHRSLSSDPRLRKIQEQSGGKFTRVLHGDPHTGPAAPLLNFISSLKWAGGGKLRHAKEISEAYKRTGQTEHIPGAVRFPGRYGDKQLSGDVNLSANRASRESYKQIENNKWKEYEFFNKLLPGSMARSEHLPDVLKQIGYDEVPSHPDQQRKMVADLQEHLKKNYPKGYFVKDVHSANTGGKFPHDQNDMVAAFDKSLGNIDHKGRPHAVEEDGGAERVIAKLMKYGPKSVMVQERLPIAPGSELGAHWAKFTGNDKTRSKEVRVHVVNGVVMPNMIVPRFDKTMHFTPSGRKMLSGAASHAQGIIDKLPDHLREASFAMDIAPLSTGGFSMVESNPSAVSGFFAPKWNAFTGLQMHKGFTGQHSVPVSAIGALGTGAAAAALTRKFAPPGGITLPSVNSEEDDAPKQAYYTLGQ